MRFRVSGFHLLFLLIVFSFCVLGLTTLQYRAPEMCDLYQKKGLGEKVDIWVF